MDNGIDVSKVISAIFLFSIISLAGCFGYPNYSVWSEGKLGEAELARADANRKIAVLEAVAKKESAKALAEAEIIRAEGAARANLIIGESLTGNENYLRYLWIDGMKSEKVQLIYVPTEAGLPILESRRLNK